MKYTLHQHEILLLRLAEHFGEVVPSGDLAVALGYLPEERNPLRAQARIARRTLPETVDLRADGDGYRLMVASRDARNCAYCGETFSQPVRRVGRGAAFKYCEAHREGRFSCRVSRATSRCAGVPVFVKQAGGKPIESSHVDLFGPDGKRHYTRPQGDPLKRQRQARRAGRTR